MANLTINGQAFGPFSALFVGGANAPTGNSQAYADGNYGDVPFESEPVYREQDVEYVGVLDGVGTIRTVWLGRYIYATLLFTGTVTQIRTNWATVHASAAQLARYSVALPNGATYAGCKLVNFDRPRFVDYYIGGIVVAAANVTLRQKSTAN